jgi:hypothetical protein
MKAKKILAATMAATMVMGLTVGVSANSTTDTITNTESTEETETSTTANVITGTGAVDYVNTKVYKVSLPTSATITLTVDPQGLSALANGKTATADDLADAAGKISCKSIVPITNLGSVPVEVTAALTLTGDATPVTAVADVTADTTTNVLLYALPSAVDTKDAAGYEPSETGIVLTKTDASVSFVLPGADYVFSKDASGTTTYVRDTTKDAHGTALAFEGYANKTADWSDYLTGATSQKNIGMTAVFTFTHTVSGTADTADGAPYAMETYSGTTVAVAGPKVTIGSDGLITVSGLTKTQNFGSLSLTFGGKTYATDKSNGTWDSTNWTSEAGGTLTYQLTAAWVKAMPGNTVGAVLTLSDGTKRSASLTTPAAAD